ncbi:MAG: class I SAM-dependent RNA methyltransferase [Pararhodobacter sp.]
MSSDAFEIFLVSAPGLEPVLADEARALGFAEATAQPGGVALRGDWGDVWRANLMLRGAARVLVRIGAFRALHLAQLDKRARRFPWADFLRPDMPLRIEATCRASRIYHAGAAAQRVETAIRETLGAPVAADAGLRLLVRIEDDLCSFSLDTSGEGLHKRGHKLAVGKAPLRETLAALFLRQCSYRGTEPVIDPMCGSGTLVIEAAEIAAGLVPGRSRRFAFEDLSGFDTAAWARLRADCIASALPAQAAGSPVFLGYDRDAGAVANARANAERAGVGDRTIFAQQAVSALERPAGPAGLVIVNPPYGERIGARHMLHAVYGALGQTLLARFSGWRVGLVSNDAGLARSTGLPFAPPGPPVVHGALKVRLFQTRPLP